MLRISSRRVGDLDTPSDPALAPERREITPKVSGTLRGQPWFHAALNRLAGFLALEEDWDGYGAQRIHESAVKRAVAVLDAVCPAGPKPWTVPTSEGGVQLEWAYNGYEIESEIPPAGAAQILIVEPSGEESEMSASSDSIETWDQLRNRIAEMGSSTA